MSTSPSWFDQEKFSRLVRKVGPKSAPEAAAVQPSSSAEGSGESVASTARISLVSKPPSLLSEHRALPALPRRTTPLPQLKALFQSPSTTPASPSSSQSLPSLPAPSQPPVTQPSPAESAVDEPHAAPIRAEDLVMPDEVSTEPKPPAEEMAPLPEIKTPGAEDKADEIDDDNITAIWHKMSLLNEELAQTIRERDQAVADAELLREQLRLSDETLEGGGNDATKEEFARLIRERDEALAEAAALKAKTPPGVPSSSSSKTAALSFGKPPEDLTKSKELTMLASERDTARKQYAELRKQFEALKQEQSSKEDSGKFRKDLEQQLEGFRQKLEERNAEIAALKAGGSGMGDDAAKAEIASLREQLAKVKDEASVAQRGLALSQKALHETRDTLREATEGSSLSRHNFDNLKTECASLSQQISVLQAQNDQLTRELAATKSKLTTRV